MQPSDDTVTADNEADTGATALLNKELLQQGSQGDAVRELQMLLTKWGTYTGAIDGIFGIQVKNAVIAYQHRFFLVEDGMVGNLTWQALYTGAPVNMPTLSIGSYGNAVITLQGLLSSIKDYLGAIDGEFGSQTKAAVIAFQKRKGLIADGIVGDRSWYYLSKVPH
ncbi:MAG TPA: peptidoglycan-binding protein [Coleofasciculaceae cyanobacterium]|jgi:peptidoglycan hydrolase-like protein with peptidoglycan-binding domain